MAEMCASGEVGAGQVTTSNDTVRNMTRQQHRTAAQSSSTEQQHRAAAQNSSTEQQHRTAAQNSSTEQI